MEGLGPISKERVLEIMKAEVIVVLVSIDIDLMISSGCCIEQIAPSIHPRYVFPAFTISSTDQKS